MEITTDLGPRQPSAPGPTSRAIELLVGGRGLQIAGFFSLFLGAAFFLKIAIDNDWIPEAFRILLGLIAGSAFVVAGFRSRVRAIGEGFVALGSATLYLSLWAASGAYHLIPPELGLAGMLGVTAALGAIAYRRRSELTALVGIAGGFATPLLIPQHAADPLALALYVLTLCGAALTLGVLARFRLVTVGTFAAALVYAPCFAVSTEWSAAQSVATATAFFVELSIALLVTARRSNDVDAIDIGLTIANVFVFLAALSYDLRDHHVALGVMLTALGSALLAPVVTGFIAKRARPIYGVAALGSLTLALPAFFSESHAALLSAFAIEGAVLFVVGARYVLPAIRWAGIAAIGGVIFASFIQFAAFTAHTPVLNDRFFTLAIIAGALLVMARVARDDLPLLGDNEAFIFRYVGFAINLIVLGAITQETLDLNVAGSLEAVTSVSIKQMALSLVWTTYASLVMALGMRMGNMSLRWQSLAIFAITIIKVFSVDLASVAIGYRVGSFISLGAVLLVISAVYLKAAGAAAAAEVEA